MDTDGTNGHEVDGELQRAAQIVDIAFERVLTAKNESGAHSVVSEKEEALKSQ